MEIEEELSTIETEFSEFKARFETYYFTMVMVILIPFICLIVYLSRFNKELFDLIGVRIILFGVMLILVAIHYILRYTYFISNRKFRTFIKQKIEALKMKFPGRNITGEILDILAKEYPTHKKAFYKNLKQIL